MTTKDIEHSAAPEPDPDALESEVPAHRVLLPSFFLARYPVTVAQWRVYYEGVISGAWTPCHVDGGKCGPLDQRAIDPARAQTRPVVYVSWYDAIDYCRWLTAALKERARVDAGLIDAERTVPVVLAKLLVHGDKASHGRPWVLTLPSEAEWERAARGTDGRNYPWVGPWDPNNAGGGEAGMPSVSAVGCFTGGRSPVGSEELSGNVREWTRSLGARNWRCYPYAPDYKGIGREDVSAPADMSRLVRGRSDILNPAHLRSAFRAWYYPTVRTGLLGFRLAVAPFRL